MLLVELGRGPAAPRVRRRVPLVGSHAISSTFTQHKRKKMYLTIIKARVPVVRLLPVHQGGRGFELREEQFFCKKNKGRGRQLVDLNHGPGRHLFTGTPSWWDRIAMSSRLGPEGGSA